LLIKYLLFKKKKEDANRNKNKKKNILFLKKKKKLNLVLNVLYKKEDIKEALKTLILGLIKKKFLKKELVLELKIKK
jgi:hypothetical protein